MSDARGVDPAASGPIPGFGPPALMFGVPIADVTMDELVELIGVLIRLGRAGGGTHQIATVNVDFLVNALHDDAIRTILRDADLCIADGTPIVWGAGLLGMPIRERVAGADLVPRLFDVSRTTGWRIHVFGSSAEVAARSRELIAERYPGAAVTIDPGPMISDVTEVDDATLDAIAEVDADVVCVALGNPKQERFIRAHRDRIGAPVMIGVGGSLDMFVGARRRAPVWVQRIGLEWVVRALQEPRRLGRRYAHDIRTFGPRFAREWRANRRRRDGTAATIDIADGSVAVRIAGLATATDGEWRQAARRLADGAPLELAAAGATTISDVAAARLVGLVRVARWYGTTPTWSGRPAELQAALSEIGVAPAMIACDETWQPERTQ